MAITVAGTMSGSYDDWYFDVEARLAATGRGAELRRIPVQDLKSAFESGSSAASFVESYVTDPALRAWLEEVDHYLRGGTQPLNLDEVRPTQVLAAFRRGETPSAFVSTLVQHASLSAQRDDSELLVTQYAEWLEDLRSQLSAHRPDIAPSDLEQNACYALWQQGITPNQVAKGHVPIKGGSTTAPSSKAPRPNRKTKSVATLTTGDEPGKPSMFNRRCRCPKCNTLLFYKIDSKLYWKYVLVAVLLSPLSFCISWILIIVPLLPREVQCYSCEHYFNAS